MCVCICIYVYMYIYYTNIHKGLYTRIPASFHNCIHTSLVSINIP